MDKEICPYCKTLMEKGTAMPHRSGKIWWMPDDKLFPLLRDSKVITAGGLVISSDGFLSVIRMPTRVCKKCGYLTIWTDEVNAAYNKV